MSYTNISFPYTVRYTTNDQNQQIISYQNLDIDNFPMFNPLTYESVIPYPSNAILPKNRY